jgi:hypothetical protein
MLIINKLSEHNLKEILQVLFNCDETSLKAQKKFIGDHQTFRVDYYLKLKDDEFIFEFDGPTHYCNTKTQIRDCNLELFCIENKITLIRFPYFIQIDDRTIQHYFKEECIDKYNLFDKIESIYKNGFHDKKIVYPGDFNSYGWKLFYSQYEHFTYGEEMSVAKEIYDSLSSIDDWRTTLGLLYCENEKKIEFIQEYPT